MLSKREEVCLCSMMKSMMQILNNVVTPACYRLTLEFGECIAVVQLGEKEVQVYVKKEKTSVDER